MRRERDPRRLPRRPAGRRAWSSCSRSGARSSPASSCRCSRPRAPTARSPPAACATSSSARAPTSRRHDDRAAALADAHLDAVLVHSDPAFARLEETFAPRRAAARAGPLHRLRRPRRRTERRSARGEHVVVSAGGGLVGEPLLRAAAEAQPEAGVPLRLIGGPLLPDAAWERAARARRARRSSCGARSPDLGAELRGARASVSQGGYNTALEVVRVGHARAARALRDAGGGRAAAARPPARAPRRRARAGAGAALAPRRWPPSCGGCSRSSRGRRASTSTARGAPRTLLDELAGRAGDRGTGVSRA